MVVDGRRRATKFDGSAPGVMPPVAVSPGAVDLGPASHRKSVPIVGKSPASTEFLAGVNRLNLNAEEVCG